MISGVSISGVQSFAPIGGFSDRWPSFDRPAPYKTYGAGPTALAGAEYDVSFAKGQRRSALIGSLQISKHFDKEGLFVGTLVNLCLSSQKCQAHLFPQSVELITFAAAPLVLTQFVRNQVMYASLLSKQHACTHGEPLV